MSFLCIIMAFIIFLLAIKIYNVKKFSVLYKPKKLLKLYDCIIADRGLCIEYVENTIPAYKSAILCGFIPKIDIRFTKDNVPICFHDRYTKRLLGIFGNVSKKTYENIHKRKLKGSNISVPMLDSYIRRIKGTTPLVIELRGKFNLKRLEKLNNVLSNYNNKDNIYIFTSNILVYFYMIKNYNYIICYKYNLLREPFRFLYKRKYYKIKFPDIQNIIFDVEQNDTISTIVHKLWKIANNYQSRITNDFWLFNVPIAHRAIYNNKFPESSVEAINACVNHNVAIEIDIIQYKGILKCYHDDSLSEKFGMEHSCAPKINIESSIDLQTFINLVDGKVPIIFDIKDTAIFSRKKEIKIMEILKDYKGEYVIQSFNPLVLRWFYKNYPSIYRGQIGHSLNGLKKYIRNILLTITNFVLFYFSKPDYILYDMDPNVRILTEFNNKIAGLPIILYAPTSYEQLKEYLDVTDTFVVENISDFKSWKNYFKIRYNRDF